MSQKNEILQMLKDEITDVEYNRYIKQLKFDEKSHTDEYALFIAPNILISNYIKSKYSEKIATLFEIKTGIKPNVEISTTSKKLKTKKTRDSVKSSEKVQHSLLNPSHTFENFVVGGSNQFAYTAAKKVSEDFGTSYNPLFIYGGVGLGKTHLMQAIGNIAQQKGKSVVFTSVEQFLNDFTRHIRNKTMELFRDKYRKCDVLLVDDIQFLSGKESLQEEFFNTFESLRNSDKLIVLTADKKPKQIALLAERLQSRFEWGLITDIQPPELETKIEIIRKKSEINRVQIDNDVINYIATIIENNTREIEGILTKLKMYSQMVNCEITIEFAKNALKDQIREKKESVTIETIMQMVSRELNIKQSEIKSKSRTRNIVYARRIAIYLSRTFTQNSMPQLALYFGMKDHTAVSHTMKTINKLLESDADFKLKIDELKNKIS
ncbi:MAG: chromosomal replication initiator protein DnaA [Helicobacteraceae bacterium]|nr:chromosomal replication initiator protein DnaA [Helicobacteraceae bacterium]